MPSIAVLTPALNEEHFIVEMLRSLAAQTIKPKIVLVGDNESADATASVAEKTLSAYNLPHKIIRVKRQPKLGKLNINNVYYELTRALNTPMSDIDYVSTIEADVVLEPEYFEKMIKVFEENPELGIAGGWLEPLGLMKSSFPLKGANVNLWGCNRVYRASCWLELTLETDIRDLPMWDTDQVIMALAKNYQVQRIPWARSRSLRLDKPMKGHMKGRVDALHGLPLWWAAAKTLQNKDPAYLVSFIASKIVRRSALNPHVPQQVVYVYQHAATQTLRKIITGSKSVFT